MESKTTILSLKVRALDALSRDEEHSHVGTTTGLYTMDDLAPLSLKYDNSLPVLQAQYRLELYPKDAAHTRMVALYKLLFSSVPMEGVVCAGGAVAAAMCSSSYTAYKLGMVRPPPEGSSDKEYGVVDARARRGCRRKKHEKRLSAEIKKGKAHLTGSWVSISNLNDVDLFLVGLKEDAARAKIQEIAQGLHQVFVVSQPGGLHRRLHIHETRKSITLGVRDWRSPEGTYYRVQIIKRLYSTVSEVLHGFDLGSCSVAWTGKQIVLTDKAKFTYETGINLVDLRLRRAAFERRLCKYFRRGYSIGFPNMNMDAVYAEILAVHRDGPAPINKWRQEREDKSRRMPIVCDESRLRVDGHTAQIILPRMCLHWSTGPLSRNCWPIRYDGARLGEWYDFVEPIPLTVPTAVEEEETEHWRLVTKSLIPTPKVADWLRVENAPAQGRKTKSESKEVKDTSEPEVNVKAHAITDAIARLTVFPVGIIELTLSYVYAAKETTYADELSEYERTTHNRSGVLARNLNTLQQPFVDEDDICLFQSITKGDVDFKVFGGDMFPNLSFFVFKVFNDDVNIRLSDMIKKALGDDETWQDLRAEYKAWTSDISMKDHGVLLKDPNYYLKIPVIAKVCTQIKTNLADDIGRIGRWRFMRVDESNCLLAGGGALTLYPMSAEAWYGKYYTD
jgi:hypothetical protein